MDATADLRLGVLGELHGSRGDALLDLGGRRQRAVLAVLIIARGEAVPADRIADAVWGERLPADPAGALQAYVSHLRRRLEPAAAARRRDGVIARVGPGYALRLGLDAVDAWRFERAVRAAADFPPAEGAAALDEALRLWRGPAYAEYDAEMWSQAEIARLTELRAVAREHLLAARLDLGESTALVSDLEALLAEDPLREERWRLLVVALYRSQRQADALAALRRARQTLADTLGIDPGPQLRALEREVLAQSPALDAPPPAAAPTEPRLIAVQATDDRRVAATPAVSSDLVDRERETAALAAAIATATMGSGSVVLIEGPAGIGKTRLLAEALRLSADAGFRVLAARCSQLERSFGFGAVRQLFEPSLVDGTRAEGLLGGPAASATGVFDPVASDQLADGTFSVLHGLYWLTVNLTIESPLLLTVDDAQWCDPASLRFLGYLLRRLDAVPILVVVVLRTGEAMPEDILLGELGGDPSVTVLRPRPLSAEGAAVVVRERLGDAAEPFVAACHSTTSGNPLLLRQLVRALESEGIRPDVAHTGTVRAVGSRAVAGLVALRLRRMPAEATAVARAVAVLGEGTDLLAVAELAGLDEVDAAEALDTLLRGEILTDQGVLAFVHPLVRDAVHDDLPLGDRHRMHERAAAMLLRRGADAEQVAAHLLLSPHRGSATTVTVLRDAARAALSRGASDSAVALLRRALEEPCSDPQRVELLIELGLAETLVDGPSAAAHLAESFAVLEEPHLRARVAQALASTHLFASPPGVATSFAREAAASLPDDVDDARQALVALQRTAGSMSGLPTAAYRDGPPPEVRGSGDGARMLAATLSYERLLEGEDREGTIDLARFALAGDRLLEVDNGLLWVFAATVLLVSDGDLDAVDGPPRAGRGLAAFWERARRHAYATGSLFAAMSANLWRGYFQWRSGALDDALLSLADAADQNHMWGDSPIGATYLATFTAGVHVDRGDLAAARLVIEAARPLPPVGEGTRLLQEVAARLRLEEGRPAVALDELALAPDPFGIGNPAWAPWRGLKARALAGLGEVAEAIALAEEEVALLRRWGAPSALGPSLRLLGELPDPVDTGLLAEAVQVLAAGNAPVELARARLALGRSPDVPDGEALPLLHQAQEGARRCGARALQRETATELAARGATVPLEEAMATGLNSRDRRIFDLAAAGLDINEVAQRLLLTPGTVRAVLESASASSGS